MFPQGTKGVYQVADLTTADQEIPDGLGKLAFLGDAETVIR